MNALRKLLLAGTATAALFVSGEAGAVLQISANINGTIFNCADQNALCDTNPAVGTLQVANQTLAGVEFLGSSQQQVIGSTNQLNTSSFQFQNNNPGTVTLLLAVSGVNFIGPVTSYSASGSGTFQTGSTGSVVGSDATLTYYIDAANAQGADTPTDLPGTLLATDLKAALLPTDSFSFNHNGPFVDPDLHSMSLGTEIHLTAGSLVVGRNQAVLTQNAVSEPGALAMLGSSLLLLWFGNRVYRRREETADIG